MADNNMLELVVEVDVNKANSSIKSVNSGLSGMEQAAWKAGRGASAGIDDMTGSIVKAGTAAAFRELDQEGHIDLERKVCPKRPAVRHPQDCRGES
jgi:hypothetical protein